MSEQEAKLNVSAWECIKRFGGTYVKPYMASFSTVQFMHIAGALLLLAPPLLIRSVIDDAILAENYRGLALLSFSIVAILAVWTIISGIKEYWGHAIAQRITAQVRNDLYGHFQKLSMSFHDNKKTGELLARIIDDINIVQEAVHHGPETILMAIVMVFGTGVVMFIMDWQLALIGIITIPAVVIFSRALIKRMWSGFRTERERLALLSDELEENLAGMHVIKAFVMEDYERATTARANEEHRRSRMRIIKYVAMLFPGAMFLNGAAMAAVLLIGGWKAIDGAMTIGTLTAFVFLLRGFLQPLMRLMMVAEEAGRFVAGVSRFFHYMDLEPEIRDKPDAVELTKVEGEVVFEDVHFSYDREVILEGIDFRAEPGAMIALVGPSGSGKTTITRLIPRFYDPYQGRILVDGIDIRDIRQRSLRSHIGMVMQDDFLFSGTIAENIGYGRPDSTQEEIEEAARAANAEPFIAQMSDGYDTQIGKRGVKLSEGQRQRISIARALLKNPKILLLDEATSSVDSETESLIKQAVERLRSGRTTFAIAHRLSTILEADEILFIDGGRITERGAHSELIEQDGQYARFYRIQFSEMKAL